MKILVATDAWRPQVNGVVHTLGHVAQEARALGADLEFLSPESFFTLPLPSYPEIRLALPGPGAVARRLDAVRPQAIHIATEGPLGHALRRLCIKRRLPFTSSFHTRFPDYLAERLPLPRRWSAETTWRLLRRFHAPAAAVLAPTPTLAAELGQRGFPAVRLWPRGVDARLFRPRPRGPVAWPRPLFLAVGRVAVEKNLVAFLKLDLPGTKLIVGDGPARAALSRQYPQAVFVGARHGEALAEIYAAADVFVFPSRTDTYGLVLLEALASGLPVAAFPAPAPRDVIGAAPVGRLDEDLRRACLSALEVPRAACREFALRLSWEASAALFLEHVTTAQNAPRPARLPRWVRKAA